MVSSRLTYSEKDGTSYSFHSQNKTDFWCCQRCGERGGRGQLSAYFLIETKAMRFFFCLIYFLPDNICNLLGSFKLI